MRLYKNSIRVAGLVGGPWVAIPECIAEARGKTMIESHCCMNEKRPAREFHSKAEKPVHDKIQIGAAQKRVSWSSLALRCSSENV